MSEIKHKELTDEDKIRLQLIDDAISRIKSMPAIDETTKPKENPTQIGNEIIQVTPEQLILTEQKITKYKSKYNKNKYKQIDKTTAQVDPEEVVKNTYLSHRNLEVMKFIIDKLWATVIVRKRGDDFILSSDNFIKLWSLITQENEDDIEIVLEEPLMRSHSCIGNCIESTRILHIIRGVMTFLSPIIVGKIIKQGGTSNQILLANGDTIDKDKLDYESIEDATYQSIAYGMYERLIQDTFTTQNSRSKFTGPPHNIPINAMMFAQKVIGYPICWNCAIPIDCFINPNENVLIDKFKNKQMDPFGLASQGFNAAIIYALDQLNIYWHAILKTIWEAAIKYACQSKICR
ncbi:MAG: hypothetical protein EZS28_002100 [Streblomastix strix]|uniref:Uncharacterized protein n=1 Tax=Streblomastix strix TaxID=222440 RepID=A0A5J4X6T5_9EUKA|nr:MAG: hypothetical protein EZS28_002100 [Streblomastix strix]